MQMSHLPLRSASNYTRKLYAGYEKTTSYFSAQNYLDCILPSNCNRISQHNNEQQFFDDCMLNEARFYCNKENERSCSFSIPMSANCEHETFLRLYIWHLQTFGVLRQCYKPVGATGLLKLNLNHLQLSCKLKLSRSSPLFVQQPSIKAYNKLYGTVFIFHRNFGIVIIQV